MRKAKKLNPIVKYAGMREQEAANVVELCKKRILLNENKLRELNNYRMEYAENMLRLGGQGMSAAQMRNYRAFLAQLDVAIHDQENQVKSAHQEMEQQLESWQGKYREKSVVNNLQERYFSEEFRLQGKLEQKEADSFNHRSFNKTR